MEKIPDEFCRAWADREPIGVFTTVDKDGIPNSVYVGCMGFFEDSCLVIADNYFDKTRRNILAGSKGSLLFRSKDGKAYQVKGSILYEKQGRRFDFMKTINPTKHPGHAAAVIIPEEIYSGSRKLA